eukprot:scaffold200555_cov19-Tisochrysis_lutea.AAC.1
MKQTPKFPSLLTPGNTVQASTEASAVSRQTYTKNFMNEDAQMRNLHPSELSHGVHMSTANAEAPLDYESAF